MVQNEDIEIRIWEYIDNQCSEGERAQITNLIATNTLWDQKFRELSALNSSFTEKLDLEQPSMRFSKNVMDAVAATHVAPAAKKYINLGIIKGIAAFFLLAIAITICYALASVNWQTNSTLRIPVISYPSIDLPWVSKSGIVNILIAFNVVLGLVFLDFFIAKKRVHS